MTITSVTPAGKSAAAPAASFATNNLAAVTQALPGPNSLSHFGIDAVPYAMAAMACAPPTLKTCSTPALRAATRTAGSAVPARVGGVHMTRTGQPAIAAGTASMMAVEGSGAEPAGTYSPTARSGTLMRSQSTPGAVSRRSGAGTWAA